MTDPKPRLSIEGDELKMTHAGLGLLIGEYEKLCSRFEALGDIAELNKQRAKVASISKLKTRVAHHLPSPKKTGKQDVHGVVLGPDAGKKPAGKASKKASKKPGRTGMLQQHAKKPTGSK